MIGNPESVNLCLWILYFQKHKMIKAQLMCCDGALAPPQVSLWSEIVYPHCSVWAVYTDAVTQEQADISLWDDDDDDEELCDLD